jgi:ribosomal protein S18 acetylase RimI-like enzyme
MAIAVRRLVPGDESILESLSVHDADFDLEGRGGGLAPLSRTAARDYLGNPAVLFWVAFEEATPTGFLECLVLPLRAEPGREILLYEIGVHHAQRRKGIGRALLDGMCTWMQANNVSETWVLADNPTAVEFYKACGFSTPDEMSVYMVLKG